MRERYQALLQSTNVAAGLAASATIASMRWTSTTKVAVVKEVVLCALTNTTAFTAGYGSVFLQPATAFSASDTGEASATKNKLRGIFAASAIGADDLKVSQTAAVTAGTRTLGGLLGGFYVAFDATANKQWLGGDGATLLRSALEDPDDGLFLTTNTGFVVVATVPATGVWQFCIRVKWEERSGTA